MATIPTWIWYDPSTTYVLATTNQSAFQTGLIGTTINLASYNEDASLEDANEDGRIDDLDRLGLGDTAAFDPPADEGITIDGTFRQIQTFATFNTTFQTTDGQTLSPIRVAAY